MVAKGSDGHLAAARCEKSSASGPRSVAATAGATLALVTAVAAGAIVAGGALGVVAAVAYTVFRALVGPVA